MGMYTEILIKANIRTDISPADRAALDYLFGHTDPDVEGVLDNTPAPAMLPDHRFFETTRWDSIGSCSSYYHIPKAVNFWEVCGSAIAPRQYLFSRSDLKNYDGEIEAFWDWFRPLVRDYGVRECIGWQWYEEADAPTLIYSKEEDSAT